MLRFLFRYLLSVVILVVVARVAFDAWPWLGEAYQALSSRHVSGGQAVIGLALLGLLQLQLEMARRRSRRELEKLRRAVTELNSFAYPPSPWSRAAR